MMNLLLRLAMHVGVAGNVGFDKENKERTVPRRTFPDLTGLRHGFIST